MINDEPISFDADYDNEEENICPKCCGECVDINGNNCRTCGGTGTKKIIEKKKST